MKIAGICLLVLGGMFLLIAGLYFWVYLLFEKMPHKTGRTLGKLCSSQYKKDAAVWSGLGKFDGPPKIAYTIKHFTKSKYLYGVNNKLYLCAFDFWKKPHKIPNSAWVIYCKAFPRFSYLDSDENYFGAFALFVKAIGFLGIAICMAGLGAAFLLKA